MIKLSVKEALQIAEEHFPHGLEEVVKRLGVAVDYENLGNSDGYVLKFDDDFYITINETHAKVRQRFTLAHEIAHILLGIVPIAGENIDEFTFRDSKEEERVNRLGCALLIPESKIITRFNELPINIDELIKYADSINVSVPATVCRVVDLAEKFGMHGAMALFYKEGEFLFPRKNRIKYTGNVKASAEQDLHNCRESYPQAFREIANENTIYFSMMWENPRFSMQLVLIQLINREQAEKLSPGEKIRKIKKELFGNNTNLAKSFTSTLGAFNVKSQKHSIEEAVTIFFEKVLFDYPNENLDPYKELLTSDLAIEYVQLNLQLWRSRKK